MFSASQRVDLLPVRELDGSLLETWARLQSENPDLASPCFSPDFILAIGNARNDIEVLIVTDSAGIAAFFPFQRGQGRVGTPAGGIIADYQGIICRKDFDCDPQILLRAANLSV